MEYRKYDLTVEVNGIRFEQVWIDPHYEERHSESMNDELILKLVQQLSGRDDPEEQGPSGYMYVVSLLEFDGKPYKLIWLFPPDHSFLGVRNAFRQKKATHRRSK